MKRIVAIAVVLLLSAAGVTAITVTPMTFEELVHESTAVVYARVADVRGQWTADRRGIDSIVTLQAVQYLKGNLGETVLMRLPGGEAGGMISVLPGAPSVRSGDLVVLFLGARGPAMLSPVGLTQGVFRVVHDARTGSTLVTPPPLKGSVAGRIVRGAADRRALTLTVFAAEVRAVLGAEQ
jgi:hypothetical protein